MSSDRDEMLKPPFLSIVVPVHNEQAILDKQVGVIRRSMRGIGIPYEVLLVENGSRDQTLKMCRELAGHLAEVRVLSLRDPGIGGALRLGLREAHGSFAYLTAIDFWSDEFIRDCLARAGEYDLIIGSKVVPGSQDRRQWHRRLVTRVYNALLRSLLDSPVTDPHGPKLVRTAAVRPLLNPPPSDALFEAELALRAHAAGLRLLELPVSIRDMRPPRAPLWRRAAAAAWLLIKLRLRTARRGRR